MATTNKLVSRNLEVVKLENGKWGICGDSSNKLMIGMLCEEGRQLVFGTKEEAVKKLYSTIS